MNTATMKCWSISSNQNGFKSPELVRHRLRGLIYDDSRGYFPDGSAVETGNIISVTDNGSHKVVTTERTAYTVYPGDVDPEYEAQFPGAYGRIPCRKEVSRGTIN